MEEHTPSKEFRRNFLLSIEAVFWGITLTVSLLAWRLPLQDSERRILILMTGCAILFIIWIFHWVVPRHGLENWVNYLGSIGAIVLVSFGAFFLRPYHINLDVLFVVIIAVSGIAIGKKLAIPTTIMAVLAEASVNLLHEGLTVLGFLITSIQSGVLLIGGLIISYLAGAIYEQINQSEQRSQYLRLLLMSGLQTADLENLQPILQEIISTVQSRLPLYYCQFFLLADETIQPADVTRTAEGHVSYLSGDGIQELSAVCISKGYCLLQGKELQQFKNSRWDIFPDKLQSLCLIPIDSPQGVLGILAAGELRPWETYPANDQKLEFLQTLANQIAAKIYNLTLHQKTLSTAQRLQMLNEVARAIGSTIELEDLLELIYRQLNKVIESDTYFVTLYDADSRVQDVRILIDKGKRYAPQKVSIESGLSSWVYKNRKPLLIHNLPDEIQSLGLKIVTLGNEEISKSWLGVPMLAGDEYLGLLAIASYRPAAFSQSDLDLLQSVAAQAALALDNARHHADVSEQARRDSLSGAYNHNFFLQKLYDEIKISQKQDTPLSLIMIDIDYFKEYNDNYGHLVGDRVLTQLVEAIQANIRPRDVIGRWGGEEFGILLPGANTDNAIEIANRIRQTLAEMQLFDTQNERIPNPTISQGIATFPLHAQNAIELVHAADTELLNAKQAGRDQIMIAE